MGQNLQSRDRLRPVDLARAHGLSTQAVRNYEEAGILPAADRTPHGYRAYTPLHARALSAFLALVPGHGHRTAAAIMRAVNLGTTEEAFRLVDESHAQLLEDRGTLRAVERALRDLDTAAMSVPTEPDGPGGTFIGPLAERLGIRPATLRT
ncbi:MerR family DNA-binding transcriptional regulator, partial [Streptomyces sp. NPDC058953]